MYNNYFIDRKYIIIIIIYLPSTIILGKYISSRYAFFKKGIYEELNSEENIPRFNFKGGKHVFAISRDCDVY